MNIQKAVFYEPVLHDTYKYLMELDQNGVMHSLCVMIRGELEIGIAVGLAFSNFLIFSNLAFQTVPSSPFIKIKLKFMKA